MPSGADEDDSFEKDEEFANSIFSQLLAEVRPGAREENACLDSGVPAQPLGFKFTSPWQKPSSYF